VPHTKLQQRCRACSWAGVHVGVRRACHVREELAAGLTAAQGYGAPLRLGALGVREFCALLEAPCGYNRQTRVREAPVVRREIVGGRVWGGWARAHTLLAFSTLPFVFVCEKMGREKSLPELATARGRGTRCSRGGAASAPGEPATPVTPWSRTSGSRRHIRTHVAQRCRRPRPSAQAACMACCGRRASRHVPRVLFAHPTRLEVHIPCTHITEHCTTCSPPSPRACRAPPMHVHSSVHSLVRP